MRKLRRHRLIAAWLAIAALLGNTLLAAMCAAPAKPAQVADSILGPLVICTSHGAVTASEDGGSNPPQSPTKHCPACAVLGKVALLPAPPPLVEAETPDLPGVRPMPTHSWRLAEHLGPGHVRSRAPPAARVA
jgi:hypothetical protein